MKKSLIIGFTLFFSASLLAVELPDFTDLIEKTSPAVVKINVTARVARTAVNPFGSDQNIPAPFRDFFDRYYQMPEQESRGIGSGFIISKDGYIVTNAHVVEDASDIRVRLNDRREYNAEVIGMDQRSDLAVIKIDETGLPTVTFAPADSLKPGNWVVAIGSPFDLDYSASAGIVSAVGRSLPSQSGDNYVPFIQTDVAINPGNSGGPLFNLKGEVVGINSQIFTRSGGYMGLSFAIPVNVAQEVIAQIKETGTVSRGWLGVLIQEVTADLAKSFQLDKPQGALVSQVVLGGPAEAAGLIPGDVIMELNGNRIAISADLPHVVGLLKPGTKVPAKIMREGKQKTIDIRIGELTDQSARAVSQPANGRLSNQNNALGVVVTALSAQESRAAGIDRGIRVEEVIPDSAADRAGLAVGDIIVQIGFKEVSTPEEFMAISRSLKAGSVIPIRFFRNGSPIFRTLQVD